MFIALSQNQKLSPVLIFHNGKLVKEYRKVKAAGHAEQVLADLKVLQAV